MEQLVSEGHVTLARTRDDTDVRHEEGMNLPTAAAPEFSHLGEISPDTVEMHQELPFLEFKSMVVCVCHANALSTSSAELSM